MEYREFGKAGFKVSLIGMGTYFDAFWIALAMVLRIRRNARRIIGALKLGLDAGINLIDTAEVYQSESLVAEAIQGRKRDELFIATKVSPWHLRYNKVLRACEKSLKRLKTSYIDLYQIHFPNNRVPIKETMRAMEKLVDDGKIRYIGISNFPLRGMMEAENALSKHEVISTQMNYSLVHRELERDILPHCEAQKITVLAYFPIGHGKLAGARMSSTEAYRDISSKYRGKTPAQVALNWLFSKSDLVFPIPRGSNPRHVEENLGALGWRFDQSEMELLERTFPI